MSTVWMSCRSQVAGSYRQFRSAPILFVTHDADDVGWQFLCGTTDDPADAWVVGLGRMYRLDATVGELADLPEGWRASRSAAALPWQRAPA